MFYKRVNKNGDVVRYITNMLLAFYPVVVQFIVLTQLNEITWTIIGNFFAHTFSLIYSWLWIDAIVRILNIFYTYRRIDSFSNFQLTWSLLETLFREWKNMVLAQTNEFFKSHRIRTLMNEAQTLSYYYYFEAVLTIVTIR